MNVRSAGARALSLKGKRGQIMSMCPPPGEGTAPGCPCAVPEGPGPCPAVPQRAGAPSSSLFPSGTRGRFLLLWRRLPGPRGNRRLPGESGKRPGCQRARRPLAPLPPALASPGVPAPPPRGRGAGTARPRSLWGQRGLRGLRGVPGVWPRQRVDLCFAPISQIYSPLDLCSSRLQLRDWTQLERCSVYNRKLFQGLRKE